MSATHPRPLRPDGPRESRADRARADPMAVLPLGAGRYDVVTPEHGYTVDLRRGTCTCPDYRFRGARCKHLRRAAIDVTRGVVPAPHERTARCADCGRETFVPTDEPAPVYCEACTLGPGDFAVDRETDDLLVVVRTTDRRARDARIPGTGYTVATYPGNDAYDPADRVVEVVYPVPADAERVRESPPRAYSFPRGRLRRARE